MRVIGDIWRDFDCQHYSLEESDIITLESIYMRKESFKGQDQMPSARAC